MPAGKRAFLQGAAFWGVVLALCYLGLRYALPCFLPLVLGAVMAAALHPAAAGLCRRLGWRYRPCAVLVAVAALTLLGLMLWGIGGVVVRQGSALLPQIPAFYRETLLPLAEELREKWQTLQQGRAGGGWGTSLEEVLQNAVTTLSRRVVGWLGGIASSLPSILFTLTFTVLSTIFFLQDYAGITGFIVRSLPGRWLRPMVESKRYLLGAVQKVLFAYLCIMFITFGEITLGLWLLRVPYFAAIAFAIALLDILPFIGSGLFLIPWGAYHLLISRQTALGAGLLLLYAVVTVVRMWLEPRIVGGRIGLHPLATLTAMYAGLKIFGFWGLLLAPLGTTLLLHLRQGGYLRGRGRPFPFWMGWCRELAPGAPPAAGGGQTEGPRSGPSVPAAERRGAGRPEGAASTGGRRSRGSAVVGQGQGKAPTHRVESRGSAFGFTMTRKGATLCISLSINSAALRSLMLLDCAVPPGSWRRPRRPASILSRWFLRRERPPTACCKVRRS